MARSSKKPKKVFSSSRKNRADGSSYTIPRSVSWDAGVLNLVEAHRAKLGLDRSKYIQACAEHILGFREHPELFGKSTKLTEEEIEKLTDV